MFQTGLGDFACETLRYFSGLGKTPSLRDQSRHVGARCDISAFLKRFNVQLNRYFAHGLDAPILKLYPALPFIARHSTGSGPVRAKINAVMASAPTPAGRGREQEGNRRHAAPR